MLRRAPARRAGAERPQRRAKLIAFRLVSGFIIGLAQAQLESVTGPAHGPEGDPAVAQALALPPERFPHLIEIARATAQSSPRRQFEAGLETILAGLDTC